MDENKQVSQNNQEDDPVISLGNLWGIFIRHWILIVLAGLIVTGAVMIYGKFIRTPMYGSTSTLYILKQQNSSADVVYDNPSSDFSLALNIVNDCSYMIRSHAVLDTVIQDMDLDMNYKSLYDAIKINNPEKSRILEITVSTDDPELSKRIADDVCVVAARKINDTLGTSQMNVYSLSTVSNAPNNSIGAVKYVLAGVAAMVAVYLIFLVIFILDDKIKDEDDVQRYLGLSVLGNIPNGEDFQSRYGKYRYYSKYKYKYNSKYQSRPYVPEQPGNSGDGLDGFLSKGSQAQSDKTAADKGGKQA